MKERAMFKGVVNLIIKQDDKILLFFLEAAKQLGLKEVPIKILE